jgi:hypothetical protein
MLNRHLATFDFDICHPYTWATRVTSQRHRLNYWVIISLFRFFIGFFFNRDLIMYILHFSCNVRNDLTFDSVEPPVNISIPRI